jgi:hypothetical protein
MVKKVNKSGHSVAMTALSAIVLTILVVSLVNLGLSIFIESPEYDDYCPNFRTQEIIETAQRCEELEGKWNDQIQPSKLPGESLTNGYCDRDYVCRAEYEDARGSYNQVQYYVFASLGLALLLLGLLSSLSTVQYSGMAAGGILLLEGIVTNLDNKVLTFVSLLIILGIFGYLVYQKIEKK